MDCELKIGTEVIERIGNNCKTKYFKFVGIHLDEHISWQYQINHVHAKLASANYAISSSKHFLPRKIRLTLYNSLFRSHLEFGILAWGGLSSNKLLKITNTQKKCVRNVAGKGHRSHTGPIFSSLGLLKFNDLFKHQCSIFMHKYLHNKLPNSFDNTFTPLAAPNRTNSYQLGILRKKYLSHFPTYQLPITWNSNCLSLKCTTNGTSFKNNLKELILATYPPAVKCNSRSCPDCYK